ncbi:MAG: S8 family peptidase [Chloroflexota bacterium]
MTLFSQCALLFTDYSSAVAQESTPSTAIIAFDEELNEAGRDALLASHHAELVQWIPELNMAQVRILDASTAESSGQVHAAFTNRAALLAQLETHSAIDFIEDNRAVQGTYLPNDPAFAQASQSYAQDLLQLEAAWEYTTGSTDVVIAVLDTGINSSHPEFTGQIVPGYNFVSGNYDTNDDNGHGTHVAGIIGARMDNYQGGAGVCPRCKIMPVKVLDEFNIGLWSVIVQGIVFATDEGAQIINLSLGSGEQSVAVQRAVEYAQERGVLLVAAAGNSRSQDYFYPAAYSGVLSVAATDNNDREWGLSNRGNFIDIAAPGYLIYSTSRGDSPYHYMTGTSMATPFVTGLAGLLLSQSPQRTSTDLTELILYSATDLGELGWDPIFGFGRIDALAALENAQSTTIEPSAQDDSNITSIFIPFASR